MDKKAPFKKCVKCSKKFVRKNNEAIHRFEKRQFCSKSCKGKSISKENLKKFQEAAWKSNKGRPSWNAGKKWPEMSLILKGRPVSSETRKKQSEVRRELFRSGKLKVWNRGIPMWKNRTHPKGTLGKTSKFKGKTFEQIYGKKKAEELKKRLSDAVSEQRRKGSFKQISKEEEMFCTDLKKMGFIEGRDFIRQMEFKKSDGTRYKVDFAFPKEKVIIEYYGSWHHGDPRIRKYFDNEPVELSKIQIKTIKRDEERAKFFIKNGWQYEWVWSIDLYGKTVPKIARHNRPLVLDAIKKLIEKKRNLFFNNI